MVVIQGGGVSPGMAAGRLYFYRRPDAPAAEARSGDIQGERARLADARQAAAEQLRALAEQARTEAGGEAALLFETHAMLAEDEDYLEAMDTALEEGWAAVYAVQTAGERFSALFAAMDDPYMQARAEDVRDVTRRILNNLTGAADGGIRLSEPVILAAEDLAPSETLQLDRSKLLGIATRGGSGSSHTAILARTLGIPAVCGLGEALKEAYNGLAACLDGEAGRLTIEPDGAAFAAFTEKARRRQEEAARAAAVRDREDVTLDGRRLDICCNIASPRDVEAVLANGGRGIGLFRSEFLFLSAGGCPGEEEQFRAYKAVAQAMGDRRVVIRTLDIGADKRADYLRLPKEENPALGLRGIRLCLERPALFRTQLRAICRASAFGRVAVMFPMIASVWEVRACRQACREVMAELDAEGIPYRRDLEIGIMVETPAAVFLAEELAREADFFSVGTNDLTQYTLACDRQAGDLDRFFDPRHPAVLRAVRMAAEAAHRAGIWVGICGELAGDPSLLPAFLAMGIDELSVPPAAVLPLREKLRGMTAADCVPEPPEAGDTEEP